MSASRRRTVNSKFKKALRPMLINIKVQVCHQCQICNLPCFVCLPCTSPELEIIQVRQKDHSHCHVSNYIYLYYTMPGLGPFLNNEIIQCMANLSPALHCIRNCTITSTRDTPIICCLCIPLTTYKTITNESICLHDVKHHYLIFLLKSRHLIVANRS